VGPDVEYPLKTIASVLLKGMSVNPVDRPEWKEIMFALNLSIESVESVEVFRE
jgi:hypothetical protein